MHEILKELKKSYLDSIYVKESEVFRINGREHFMFDGYLVRMPREYWSVRHLQEVIGKPKKTKYKKLKLTKRCLTCGKTVNNNRMSYCSQECSKYVGEKRKSFLQSFLSEV